MLASNEAPSVLTSSERQTRKREKVGFRILALRHLPAQLIGFGVWSVHIRNEHRVNKMRLP